MSKGRNLSKLEVSETGSLAASNLNSIVDAAPGALDTLNELAAALGDDANFATSVTNSLALKANASALTNVENKSSATIRSELTNSNVTTALGYIPMIGNGDYNLNNSINLNTVVNAGAYRIGNTAVNLPSGSTGYGQLLVLRSPTQDTITQIYSEYTTSALYTRSGNPAEVNGLGVWGAWKKVAMTDMNNALTVSEIKCAQFTNTGNMLKINGGAIRQWTGDAPLTTGFTVDIPIGYQGSALIICNHWHWGNGGYGAGRMSNVGVGPNTSIIENNIQNFATGMGGSFSIAKLDNNTVRVTKTAGSYAADCPYHITSIGL